MLGSLKEYSYLKRIFLDKGVSISPDFSIPPEMSEIELRDLIRTTLLSIAEVFYKSDLIEEIVEDAVRALIRNDIKPILEVLRNFRWRNKLGIRDAYSELVSAEIQLSLAAKLFDEDSVEDETKRYMDRAKALSRCRENLRNAADQLNDPGNPKF
ncbi:MAG: hypothetical protein ACRBF0_13975 [Calditrichia bacterium]